MAAKTDLQGKNTKTPPTIPPSEQAPSHRVGSGKVPGPGSLKVSGIDTSNARTRSGKNKISAGSKNTW